MWGSIFPIFTKGRVLKKESLECLRDFPRDLADASFCEYSDGILFGFTIRCEKDGYISISKGACKYKGEFIVLPAVELEIPEYGRLLYAKLIVGEIDETPDCRICPITIELDSGKPLKENEVELGRFSLNRGAVLRFKHDSFRDLRTPENTLDITSVPFAGIGGQTLNPIVMKMFAHELMLRSSDPVDIGFALLCLAGNIVNKSSIQWFLAKKDNLNYNEYEISILYEKLEILLSRYGTHELKPEKKRGLGPTIS